MLTRWSDSHEQISKILEGKPPRAGGGTNLYHLVEHAVKSELLPDSSRRRAVVLLTDGRDSQLEKFTVANKRPPEANEHPADYLRLLETLRAERVPVYVLAIDTDFNQRVGNVKNDEFVKLIASYRLGPKIAKDYLLATRLRMESIAESSGGLILFPKTMDEIVPNFKQIAEELRSAYSLGYVSTQSPAISGFREIKVSTRDPQFYVRQSRRGYTQP